VSEHLKATLGKNVRQLRETRGFTQQQAAKVAGVPRATWSHLESALQVTMEELVAVPRAECVLYPAALVKVQQRGQASIRKLLPDPIAGMEIDRFELPPGVRTVGVPHTPGTREYLTCERGQITLVAAGETYTLSPGDVVAFRGDQRHSYANPGKTAAIAYSVVALAR
jgi:quercetin dioxygenase-like cupin family protein/DNA-binding XRE family transcriptional regulator